MNSTVLFDEEKCIYSRVLGGFLTILIFSSVLVNVKLIWVIGRYKKLHSPINYLNLFMAAVNLCLTLSELPLVTANAFNCGFLYGKVGCQFLGFFLLFATVCFIYTLMTISIERYLVICKPFNSFSFSTKRCMISISLIWLTGIIWAVLPIYGWSDYVYDTGKITCWINEDLSNSTALGNFLIMFIFLYLLPTVVFIYTNGKSIMTIKTATGKFNNERKKLKKESHLMKIALFTICAFFITYTPYAIVLVIRFITGYSNAVIYFIVMFLTRSAICWPSAINLFMNKDIRPFLITNIQVHATDGSHTTTH